MALRDVFPKKSSEMFFKSTNILQEWLGKKPLLSAQFVEKRLRFETECSALRPKYWRDVIFSDETKIMLYYHAGSQREAQGSLCNQYFE